MERSRITSLSDRPIKQKLTIIIVVITAAALLLSGAGMVIIDSLLFRQYLQRDLSALAQIIADNSTAALAFEDPRSATETLAALRVRTHLVAACIYRADGGLFARYTRPGSGSGCPTNGVLDGVEFTNKDLTVRRPVVLKDRRLGTLSLIYDLGEISERMRLYGATVFLVLLASSLIALLLSSRLREVITTPISQLARAAMSVSATRDYSIRAPKLSRDELGLLVDAFNEMLAGIQSRDAELKRALLEREEALKAAQIARDSLRTTLASIGDAVISTDAEGCVVFINPIALSLTRWSESEVVGKHLDDILRLINEQTREKVESPAARVLREGAIAGMANHTVLIARDGTEVPIDDSAAPIRNERRELTGVVLIFRDITQRRKAEQELRSTREQLQLVTDTMAAAVTRCSREHRYIWVNRRYAEWLAGPSEEIAGQMITDVLGAEGYNTLRPYIEQVLTGQRTEFETQVKYTTIGERWIHATYEPTRDASGVVDGWVAEVSDITALKKAQAQVARMNVDLRKTNESLARSNEDLARFAFMASHDLQEPLRMITTYAQLLEKRYHHQLDREALTFVDHIVGGSRRMRELLADLLTYTQIGEDTESSPEPADLNAVLQTVLQNLRLAVEENHAVITSDPLPAVNAYAAHCVLLFQNLIGNAIKYRSEDPPRVHISVQREGSRWRFAVADNGIGIAPEYHQRIFGMLKRLHGKEIPGTGIGLAICQRVVERYNGKICVESQAGQGATFLFTLPDASHPQEESNA